MMLIFFGTKNFERRTKNILGQQTTVNRQQTLGMRYLSPDKYSIRQRFMDYENTKC